jgi:hypothetical protein
VLNHVEGVLEVIHTTINAAVVVRPPPPTPPHRASRGRRGVGRSARGTASQT